MIKKIFEIGPGEGEPCSFRGPLKLGLYTRISSQTKFMFVFDLFPLLGIKVALSCSTGIWLAETHGGWWWLHIDLYPLSPVIQIRLRIPVFYTKRQTMLDRVKKIK